MNKIGLIGGMGPESTVEYYQGIIDKFKAESDDLNYPDIIIYSVNLSRFIGLVNSGDERGAVDYLSEKLKKS
ncbi:aspartate/glutamate racemase family protein [Anaerophaga thermohalophila]|uniref:aspartate/glutamate racemase family protein n=1 Tax=Anaerophaga thermohalophila TaxID=177400 RepID=UPI0002F01660|nr:aspartate/glutamate racemase family protein [Anaerophaga thermohalophila]